MDSDQLHRLEERIRRSEDLVVPSDTLRGRVVSEVLRRHSGREFANNLSRFCCLALICQACVLMTVRSMDRWWSDHYHPVSSRELLTQAHAIQRESRLDANESLAEAYSQWKTRLASHWKSGDEYRPD
ncbi:MAG: hypothetical protein ACKOAU_06990 [Pirellula sp.]|jgi:hypothetical protein